MTTSNERVQDVYRGAKHPGNPADAIQLQVPLIDTARHGGALHGRGQQPLMPSGGRRIPFHIATGRFDYFAE